MATPISQESFSQIHEEFKDAFGLDYDTDIRQFFAADKNDPRQVLAAKLKRFAHFLGTGVIINEKSICKWADSHADKQFAELFSGKTVHRKVIRHQAKMVVPERSYLTRFKDAVKFLGEFIRHPTTVGAILPSSPRLAKEIVSDIPKDLNAPPRLILEVGPGTGIFTDKIIKRMNPQDELHIVEFDEKFVEQLKEKYKDLKNVTVIQGDILEHNPTEQYDYVVSGLPLNAFEADFVKKVFDKFTALTKPSGKISYFEYMGIPTVKKIISNPKERENLEAILKMKKEFYKQHKERVGHVILNAPCARVLHHEIKATNS